MSAILSEYELPGLSEFEWEGEDEFEYEDEYEGEEEFGDILGGIARSFLGESEFEDELEGEFEAEYETEAFFSQLKNLASRAISSPALRNIALSGAKAALGGLTMPPGAAGALGHVATLLTESEEEGEWEGEFELNPVRKVYPNAMLEHLGHAATEAENEGEAFAFLAPLVPLAAKAVAKLAPKAVGMLAKSTPKLVRGITNVGKKLYRNPSTRPLMRVLPTVAKRTVHSIAKQVAHGRPVTPTSAVRTLARQTARTLGHPHHTVRAYHQSKALDRHFHKAAPRTVKREMVQLAREKRAHAPHVRWVRGPGGRLVQRHYRRHYVPGHGWRWLAARPGHWVGGTAGRTILGAAPRHIAGVHGRPIAAAHPITGARPITMSTGAPRPAHHGHHGHHHHHHHCGCCCR